MNNYKEKALHHIKRKMINKYIVRGEAPKLELIYFEEPINVFISWVGCYNYLKNFTKSTKRKWIEDKKGCRLVIWDTDLEPIEQDAIDSLLEFFDYEKGSFEIDELQEIIAENIDKPICEDCQLLIEVLEENNKKIIEVE